MPSAKEIILLGAKSPVNSKEYRLGIVLGTSYLNGSIDNLNDEWPPVEKVYENPLDDFIDEFSDSDIVRRSADLHSNLCHILAYVNVDYLGKITLNSTVIHGNSRYAYWHAKHILGRRWPEAEPYIKADSYGNYFTWNRYKEEFGLR